MTSKIAIKKRIMSPGPVEIPPSVLSKGGMPIIHHRTPEFRQVLKEVEEDLRYVFQTQNRVLILKTSRTARSLRYCAASPRR